MGRRTGKTGRGQAHWPSRGGVIGAIDIGSTKIAALILKPLEQPDGEVARFRVIGHGQQASRGVRAGNVVDIAAAEAGIRAAVDQAEHMAGVLLKNVHVALSCGAPRSQVIGVEVPSTGGEVSAADLSRAIAIGRARFPASDREVLHCMPSSFSVDGARGIRNPVGMLGDTLGVSLHAVSVAQGPLRNLEACVGRSHLDIAGKAVSAYAAGLATLVADEIELGATVIDMGGGTTSIAVFMDGGLVHAEVLPIGGNHVTSDIARGLSTSLSQAERLKTLFGSTLSGPNDARELIPVQQIGEDDGDGSVPRSILTGIIQPRIEETLEMVRDRLAEAGLSSIAARRVVLTGGASQLNGIREIASRIVSKQVRLGKPACLADAPDTVTGAAFSACAGLASWALQRPKELAAPGSEDGLEAIPFVPSSAARGIVGIKRWLKENF
ncbi:MAG: cell division protein FtsA [Alphaproteobacteria bacterium]|nr:cell division protein FtsA [Alphaproteobacteria bacterium]